jgi:trimeric autotransporter adhesin
MNFARIKLGAAIAGTLAFGCGLGASGPEVTRIDGINVTPGRLALLPFQSAPLTAVAITSRRDTTAMSSLQWSTTGGTIVNNGVVGGLVHITYTSPAQPGDYQLRVTTTSGAPTAIADIAVTATPVPVNVVTVAPGSVSVALQDTTRFHATLTAESGGVIFGRPITWASSDSSVVMVFAEGFVRATAVGTATITATSEGRSGTAVITVHQ